VGAPAHPAAYRRVLLKVSGEALAGARGYGIDPETIGRIAEEIREVVDLGDQIAVVIGGGSLSGGEGSILGTLVGAGCFARRGSRRCGSGARGREGEGGGAGRRRTRGRERQACG